jgi:cytochrome c oxidase subunit 1
MALIIRPSSSPGLQVVDNPEQFNQLFTMHGRSCCCCSRRPLFAGFSNALVPLQIGAPDVAFPRLNMFAYWLYVLGGLVAALGFLTPQGAASFGWFMYVPLSNSVYSPGLGTDLGSSAWRSVASAPSSVRSTSSRRSSACAPPA